MRSKRALSFKYAFEGVATAFRDQPNLKLHLVAAIAVIFISYFLQITKTEWLVIILTVGFVITAELTNTAIEEVVDSFTDQVHPAAKKAKDVAAAAVLVASITAVIIGGAIFLPYLFSL
jgi:diacylglycerol kinase